MQISNGAGASALQELIWRKSRFSNPSGNCVELTELSDGGIALRHSHHPKGPALVYTRAEMSAFIRGVKVGEFDDLLDYS
ncbi:MAG: DUF397 domain-containing protein [Actinobacteria bacterium]|nr:DUF397 domain-containing protein [Actinomycetota bacterium]